MTDQEEFLQSLAAKSDQINNLDLVSGPVKVTIAGLSIKNADAQKWTMRLESNDKVYRPSLGMRRVIAEVWKLPPYNGKSLTLYRDPDVKFGADTTGGIRISHMSHIDREIEVTVQVSKGRFKTYRICPLAAAPEAPKEPENALELAQAAADKGVDAFREWWTSEQGKSCRATAQANIDALKKRAADADAPPPGDDAPPM